MLCMRAPVHEVCGGVDDHVLSVALSQQLQSAPVSAVVVVSGQHDDDVGALGMIDHQIVTRVDDAGCSCQKEDENGDGTADGFDFHDECSLLNRKV